MRRACACSEKGRWMGGGVYVIEATPCPDFKPKQPHGDLLSKFGGKIWIDKNQFRVKMQAETIDTVSFGLLLFRLNKGSTLSFEQTRVNEEISLPRHILWMPRRA